MRASHYNTKSLSTRGMIVTVMNPTRYNLALARAKQNYQQKIKDVKQNNDKEKLKLTNAHEGKRAVDKSNHQKEVNEITENFQKKIDNQRDQFTDLLKKQEYQSTENLKRETKKDLQERQQMKVKYERGLRNAKKAYDDIVAGHPYIAKADQLETALKTKDKVYSKTLNTIKDDNYRKVKDLHEHFMDTKRDLLYQTDEKIKHSLQTMKEKHTLDDNIKTEAYEKRLAQKDKENMQLQTDHQKKIKDLKKKFNDELSKSIKTNEIEMQKERLSMKKLLIDKDRNQNNELERLKDHYQVEIYKINKKNDSKLKELEKRFQDKIETLNDTYQKDMKSKVNRMRAERLNLERSNKVAMANQKDYYENKMQILDANIRQMNEELKLEKSGG